MIAVARESRENEKKESEVTEESQRKRDWGVSRGISEGRCYYCGGKGHFRRDYKKWKKDKELYKDTQVENFDE